MAKKSFRRQKIHLKRRNPFEGVLGAAGLIEPQKLKAIKIVGKNHHVPIFLMCQALKKRPFC
jgi:hypothetical protein